MPAKQPVTREDKTAKEIADEWAEQKLTEKPVALDNSLFGVKKAAVKNLESAILAVDSAYLLIEPTSHNSKDTVLTAISDVREQLAQAVVSLGTLG